MLSGWITETGWNGQRCVSQIARVLEQVSQVQKLLTWTWDQLDTMQILALSTGTRLTDLFPSCRHAEQLTDKFRLQE